jgi:hypothetical protein
MRFTNLKILWWKITSKKKRRLINQFQSAFNQIPEEEMKELTELFWHGTMVRMNGDIIKKFGYFLVEYKGPFDGEWKGDLVDKQDIDAAFETFVTFRG